MLTLHAPAKVNLVLEVLGRRNAYHDISSIAQTIDLFDTLTFEVAEDIEFSCGEPELMHCNLVPRAAHLLRQRAGISAGARIHLEKRIPWAAGLGGGSSDATATLLGLNRIWDLGLPASELMTMGSALGSDVPLFIQGGTVMMTGRGEQVQALPDHPPMQVLLLLPQLQVPGQKTGMLYGKLTPDVFTTGQFVRAARFDLEHDRRIPEDLMFNVFEKVAEDVFYGIGRERDALQEATGVRAHLAGSGPALFVLLESQSAADKAAARLQKQGRIAVRAQTVGTSISP